jgi:hypothetical protein
MDVISCTSKENNNDNDDDDGYKTVIFPVVLYDMKLISHTEERPKNEAISQRRMDEIA